MAGYARKIFVTYDPLSETEDGLKVRMRYFLVETDDSMLESRAQEITDDAHARLRNVLEKAVKVALSPIGYAFSAAVAIVSAVVLGYALFPLVPRVAGILTAVLAFLYELTMGIGDAILGSFLHLFGIGV